MRILVTGGSGFIGKRFCQLALDAGNAVTALVRPGRNTDLPQCTVPIYGALPYDVPERAWSGVQAVVHCAAVTTSKAADQSYAVNLEGTRYLVESARRHEVGRFVFLSSQSAHAAAVSAYGITKLKGEQVIRESGVIHAILRPGLVIGPGRQGLFYRMRQSVARLPVLPLLGGGKAIVQPIHVDDLCAAILKCLTLPSDLNIELNLGDEKGLSLGEFLQHIAQAEHGKRKMQFVIPTGPVKAAVAVGEKLRLPMPISSDNLRGMEVVRRMDTASSMERIGLILRPLDEAIRDAVQDTEPARAPATPPVRVMLIGAGKIGIVHALNLRQREGVELVAIVDRNPKAFGMYRTMGFAVPYYTEIEKATADTQPDGAIIATPASTHLEVARWCIERGMPVLVEKPLSTRANDIAAFEQLALQHPTVPCHSGYMAAQFPQLAVVQQVLQSDTLGAVVRIDAAALQSHIMAPAPVRWEMLLEQSGGGALINFASHVLSLIFRLFGEPHSFEGARWPVHSTEVEDAFGARLRYPDFNVSFVGSWSAPGYPRPMNRIEIVCARGRLILDNFGASVQSEGTTQALWSQRNFDVGYNASPDYTGGGFAAEHENFIHTIRQAQRQKSTTPRCPGLPPPVLAAEAAHLEKWIHQFYAATPLGGNSHEQIESLLTASRFSDVLRELPRKGTAA